MIRVFKQNGLRQGVVYSVLIAVFSLIVAVFAYRVISRQEHKEFLNAFDMTAKNYFSTVSRDLNNATDVLGSVKLFYDASDYISRDEFTVFAQSFLQKHRVLRNLFWVPVVGYKERKIMEQEARKQGVENFQFLVLDDEHNFVVAPTKASYFPIYYMEPFRESGITTGFDLGSNELFLDAIRQAKVTGLPEATKAFHMVIDDQYKLVFFVCVPLYRKTSASFIPSGRIEGFYGVIGGIFKYSDFLDSVIENNHTEETSFFLFDSCIGEDQAQLLYLSKPFSRILYSRISDFQNVNLSDIPKLFKQYKYMRIEEVHLMGRKWVMVLVADKEMVDKYLTSTPLIVFTAIICLGIVILCFVLLVLRHSMDVEEVVAQRTKSLKDIKEELESSRQQYMLALSGSQDGIWDWDLTTNQLFLSSRWKEMLGYSESELSNDYTTFYSMIHPEDKPRMDAYLDRYLKGEVKYYKIEFRLRHKNGSYIDVLSKGEAVRDNNGIPYRMAGSHTDITERKRKEKELIRSETKFRTLYNTNSEAIMILDTESFIDCNEQSIKLFRFNTKSDFLKKHPKDVSPPMQPCGKTSAEKAQEYINKAIKEGHARFEWVHRKNNGVDFLAEVTLDAMELDGSAVLQAIVRDISKAREAEAEIQQTLEELERFNRIMMERETRILEMKKEVNTLLKQLGKDIKYKTTL